MPTRLRATRHRPNHTTAAAGDQRSPRNLEAPAEHEWAVFGCAQLHLERSALAEGLEASRDRLGALASAVRTSRGSDRIAAREGRCAHRHSGDWDGASHRAHVAWFVALEAEGTAEIAGVPF